ncbi:hypothetical protein K437DRAFT_3221 [Tilletiaria anomala UBC 951]|uniref:Secreted protein n=1 Tax=Tilletiaria anomala (strain ATCC 24038 / CBS 436.72 / UBC 951) TaxID=1037660 RepID=A0A066WLX8_TILAU|nr:uncharacterized protein K437DRAFT_3221 [Tilletiaria anomala UBC 951]KDN53603.1 hypothetical protein K437DRAFT_3221 [Tilletiaria anomala UBC 951]
MAVKMLTLGGLVVVTSHMALMVARPTSTDRHSSLLAIYHASGYLFSGHRTTTIFIITRVHLTSVARLRILF